MQSKFQFTVKESAAIKDYTADNIAVIANTT